MKREVSMDTVLPHFDETHRMIYFRWIYTVLLQLDGIHWKMY